MQDQLSLAGRRFLWVMLPLLATASVGAIVITILKPKFDAGGTGLFEGGDAYIYAVALLTTVAAGLVMVVGRRSESRRARRTSIFVLFLILIQYVLFLAMIWALFRSDQDGFFTVEKMAPVAFAFLAAAIPAGAFFQVAQTREGRYAGWVGVILCAAVWILNVLGAYLPETSFGAFPWMEASLVCWPLAIVLAACLGGVGTDRRHWRWFGVAAALAGSAMAINAIWKNSVIATFKVNTLTMIAVVVAQANLLFLARLTRRQAWVRLVALAAALTMAGALLANDWKIQNDSAHMLWNQMLVCASVCAASASVAVALLTRTNLNPLVIDPFVNSSRMTIVCPKCAAAQTVNLGDSSCKACGTHFSIAAREPQCPQCGYLLRQIASDRCPECGKLIPWKSGEPELGQQPGNA